MPTLPGIVCVCVSVSVCVSVCRHMWLQVEEDEGRRIYQPPVLAKPQKKKATSRKGQATPILSIHTHSSHLWKGKGIPWRTAARTAERL